MPQKPILSIRRNLFPLCVFLVSLLTTLAGWRIAIHQEQMEKQQNFIQATQVYRQVLERRLEAYVRFLDDMSGLFAISDSISSKQFADYINQAKIVTHHPGTNRIAYLPRVPAEQKTQHEAQMRAAGFPEYRIRTKQPQAEYYPYDYLYPLDANVRWRLLGIDPHLQPDRNQAMQKARDTDKVISTDKLQSLVMPSTESSYIFYAPVYHVGAPLRTITERRQALKGYVFAAFRADKMINSTLGSGLNHIAAVRFFDSSSDANRHLLYDSDVSNARPNPCTQCFRHTETIYAAGRTWLLEFRARAPFGRSAGPFPLFVLLGGIVGSFLLAGIAVQRQQKRLLQKQQHEQNQQFRSLFDQNPDAVYSFDLSGCFTKANAATAVMTGIPVSELIGKSFIPFIAPECLADTKKRFAQAASGTSAYGDLAIINHAGERIEISTTTVPIMRDGRIIGVFGIAKDITSRKTTEAQNLQMQQFLDATLENLPTMLFVKEAQSLRFIAWNRASEVLTGIPREDIIGKTDYDFFEKQHADYYTATDREILARGEPMDIAEESLQTRHHGVRLLHTRKVPFKMGNTQYLIGISEDITERRLAEDALKQAHAELEERVRQRTRALRHEIEAREESERALLESEEKYRSIFEQAPVGIAHMNVDGRLGKVNQRFCDIVGYSAEELKHLTYLDITHPDDLEESLALVRQVNERQVDSSSREKRYLRKDGSEVWVTATRSAILGADHAVKYYLGIIEDITQRKATEAALRELTQHLQATREDERTRIAREIHDELGGALTAVKFDLSFPIRQDDVNHSGLIKRNQETIRLVDNAVVALRRIMADLRPSILDDLGLWAGLEWLATEFQARMGIQTTFKLKGEEVTIEPNRATALFRMVQESLNNVAKHAHATAVNIAATTAGHDIFIRIQDNGRGICEGEKAKAKSFGIIGMQERAQAFGGIIKINGRPGEGTIVFIKFPMREK